MAEVGWKGGSFVVRVEFWDNERAKSLPKRVWDKIEKYWVAPPTKPNAMYLRKEFHISEITENAMREIDRIDKRLPETPFPKDYDFGEYDPMPHQMKGLNDAWGHEEHAFFFDMRLGKSFTAIHLANARYQKQQIQRLLVICPTPIKDVWGGPEGELRKFLDEVDIFTMESGQNKQAFKWMLSGVEGERLEVLIIGVESLSQGSAYGVARQFCLGGSDVMIILDESSRIKNFKSKRTEKCITLGGLCDYRVELTGTPITQGMHDLYSQMEFLHKDIIGQKSFYTFRNRYMVMGGFEGRQILGYRNANELLQLVEPYCTVVKKEEVYDLPTMPPQIRTIQPSPEQRKHFIELKHLMRTTYGDEELEARTMLERMTRFQQINGGFFPHPAKEKDNKGKTIWITTPLKSNPKLNELESMLDELGDQQVIIWARFVPEIEAIAAMLAKNGKTAVTFYGPTSPEDRIENKRKFQASEVQFFVGNQTVGGMGVKLSNAAVMIYYSNTFSWDDKTQSWSRAEDMKMTEAILYIEMVLNTVIDKSIMAAQAKKGGMAKFVDSHLAELKRELK